MIPLPVMVKEMRRACQTPVAGRQVHRIIYSQHRKPMRLLLLKERRLLVRIVFI